MVTAETFFLAFDVVLIAALIAGVISIKIKIPPVIVMLIVGMLIGPNVLGFVDEQSIDLLSELGAILLLLMVGVEFSITKLLSTGIRAIIGALIIVGLSFIITYEIATSLDFDPITAMYIGAIFSFSSTAIIIKILEQKNMLKKEEVPFIIAILIVEDLLAVFFLTFFSSLKKGIITAGNLLSSVIFSIVIMVIVYFVVKRIFEKFSEFFIQYQSEENRVFFSFALAIGMSIIAASLNLSPSIGAFLAGSLIAGLPNGKDFERILRPFALVFSSFFFLSIGLNINPNSLVKNLTLFLPFIIVFIITIFTLVSFVVFLFGSKARSAILSGLMMLPLGEFSLLIAKEGFGVTSINLIEMASLGVLITSAVCSLLLSRYISIYNIIKRILPDQTIALLKTTSKYFDNVITAFEPNGKFYELAKIEIKKSLWNSIIIIIISAVILIANNLINEKAAILGISLRNIVIVLGIIMALLPAIRIASSTTKIIDMFMKVTTWTTNKNIGVKILRNMATGIIIFILAINIPSINNMFKLPALFDLIALPLAIAGIIIFWKGISQIPKNLHIFLGKHINIYRDKILCEQDNLLCRLTGGKPKYNK